MSRGGLLLRCVRAGAELDYVPVAGAVRRGPRPPRLTRGALMAPAPKRAATRAIATRATPRRGPATARGCRAAAVGRAARSRGDVRGRRRRPPRSGSPTSTRSSSPRSAPPSGDLLQYYADVAPALLPHLRDRAMVMKRYPNGADRRLLLHEARAQRRGRTGSSTCAIEHASGSVIDFPVIDDLAALLWVINLGCIDLNQWYARCDDVDRPDYLHFDLDPVGDDVTFAAGAGGGRSS